MGEASQKRQWKWALACWALPLVVGLVVAAAYALNGSALLLSIGAAVIMVGPLFTIVGIVLAVLDALAARQAKATRWWLPALGITALLLSNSPVALGLVMATEHLDETLTVVVDNQSSSSVEGIDLQTPTERFEVNDVPPNQRSKQRFHLEGEGNVTYALQVNTDEHTGIAVDYFTGGMAVGSVTLVIQPSGEVQVLRE